jgi:DnaJ homolog subfamily B member 12
LGLQTSCSESEIKKAYRKLSLKVHPDKNSAPHADEAFKAVGLAYATLSDAQKRHIYDRYGEEDPDNRGGGGGGGMRPGGGVHMNGGQGEVSPEEIFNMFFGGMQGMNGGGPGGFHVYSSGFGPGMQFRAGGMPPRGRRRQPGTGPQAGQQQPEANPLAMLFQLLPMLLIMLVSFMRFNDGDGVTHVTYMPGENKYFSLTVRISEKFLPALDCSYAVRSCPHFFHLLVSFSVRLHF